MFSSDRLIFSICVMRTRLEPPGYCVVCSDVTATHGRLINGLKTEKRTDIHRTSVSAARSHHYMTPSVWMRPEFRVFLVTEDLCPSVSLSVEYWRSVSSVSWMSEWWWRSRGVWAWKRWVNLTICVSFFMCCKHTHTHTSWSRPVCSCDWTKYASMQVDS